MALILHNPPKRRNFRQGLRVVIVIENGRRGFGLHGRSEAQAEDDTIRKHLVTINSGRCIFDHRFERRAVHFSPWRESNFSEHHPITAETYASGAHRAPDRVACAHVQSIEPGRQLQLRGAPDPGFLPGNPVRCGDEHECILHFCGWRKRNLILPRRKKRGPVHQDRVRC